MRQQFSIFLYKKMEHTCEKKQSKSTNLNNREQLQRLNRTSIGWSNRQVEALNKYKNRLFQVEQIEMVNKILLREDNNMQFYKITPKQDLPKSFQKMTFQTLNTKENSNIGSIIKLHKKDQFTKKQEKVRKMLRDSGQIMLLSEIYNYLDDPLQSQKVKQQKLRTQVLPMSKVITQLDEWEKIISKKGTMEARFSKLKVPHSIFEERRNSSHKKEFIVKKFKIGSDYRAEIEKSLQVINCSHGNEQNLMTRFSLIENSSKMLKRELEEMKEFVQKQIQEKMKKLAQSRKQHHRLYQQKLKLHLQEQELDEQIAKQEMNGVHSNLYGYHSLNQNNYKMVMEDKKNEIDKNEGKIFKIKKNIEFLQEEAFKNEEELKNIVLAEIAYYKISLKFGIDCRETGLVWIIKRLGLQESDIQVAEFPTYLDKKSKLYLINKAKNEDALEKLVREKKQFVKEIGKQADQSTKRQNKSITRKSSIKLEKLEKLIARSEINDCIKQISSSDCDGEIPKRYCRSVKKITALREQYSKNQSLFKVPQAKSIQKFGFDLSGMTGRQIYSLTGEKLKQIDFSKLKKQKSQETSEKIFDYKAIIRKIEDLHMQMQEQDIQHEGHLLSQYKDQKELFFTLAAACFGIKRAYSLIIKNFSWKNTM